METKNIEATKETKKKTRYHSLIPNRRKHKLINRLKDFGIASTVLNLNNPNKIIKLRVEYELSDEQFEIFKVFCEKENIKIFKDTS